MLPPFSPPRILVLALGLLALGLRPAAATEPVEGAAVAPDALELRLPFADGETVEVTGGYGPDFGVHLHQGTDQSLKANDYYALDLILPEHENRGAGQPVLAAAAGTVVLAGWSTENWSTYGQRVILLHDVGDGHEYYSIYTHLESVDVDEGSAVERGQAIGSLGGSSDEDVDKLAPQLHFAVHRDSVIGGSGSGGSYGGNAVVPEPIDGYSDVVNGQILIVPERATPPDDPDPEPDPDPEDPGDPDPPGDEDPAPADPEDAPGLIGGCSSSGGGSPLAALLIALALLAARRHRSP